MKAIVRKHWGSPDVLKFTEVDKPAPRDNEVSVQMCAASVNPADLARMRGIPLAIRLLYGPARADGLREPKDWRLGTDIAGRVESVGNQVTLFHPGDEVFGASAGAFAEYACAAENRLALKPANISFEEAAAVPVAALTALQGLRDKGQIQPGQKVLIDGASGGVGTFAVQIAKAFGTEVTAVCSTRNLDTARSIGADHVVDYTREDFTRNGQQYDLILGVNGYHPILDYRRGLSPNGTYVMAGVSRAHLYQSLLQTVLLGSLISRTGRQKMGFMGIEKMNQQDLIYIKELLEAGKVVPVIDRRYPLHEAADALRYLEEGHAQGKVVITVDRDNHTEQSPDQRHPG